MITVLARWAEISFFIQQLVNGLGIGGQYALWAVGYGLVYQVLGLMHFAHGDTIIFASFVAFSLLLAGVPLPLVAIISMSVAAAIATGIQRIIYRPLLLRGQTFLAFIGALAAGLLLRNGVSLIWGNYTVVFPDMIKPSILEIAGIRLSTLPLVNLLIALIVVILFQLFLDRTRYGQAIVAVAQDRQMAGAVGVPESRMVAVVYGLSGAIGVIGALLYVSSFKALTISVGFRITLVAFIASILGGIGTVRGAVIGGLMLGVAESMIVAYVSTLYRDAIIFGLLAAFLVIRPHGLMGRRQEVKL